MRISRSLTGLLASSVVVSGGILAAPSANAAPATPAAISIDCSALSPSSASVSGAVGDTFTITNTAASGAFNTCDLFAGSVYFSGSTGLPSGATQPYSIVASGTFNVYAFNGVVATITITVSNGGGSGDGHIPGTGVPRPQDVPSAPQPSSSQGPTAVAGPSSIRINWMSPANAGERPVTLYVANAVGEDRSCSAAPPATSCSVWPLDPAKEYSFVVQAFNTIGWGAKSSPTAPLHPLAPPLDAPRVTGLAMGGDATSGYKLNLKWEPAGGNPWPQTYTVEYAHCGEVCIDPVEGASWRSMDFRAPKWGEPLEVPVPDIGPWVVRMRGKADWGVTSDWSKTRGEFEGFTEATTLSQLRAFASRNSDLIRWAPLNALQQRWLHGFKIDRRVKSSWHEDFGSWLNVGRTYGPSEYSVKLSRGEALASQDDYVQFRVRPILTYGAGLWADQNRTPEVRQQTSELPLPDFVSMAKSGTAGYVAIFWNPPANSALGQANVSGYVLQYYDAKGGLVTATDKPLKAPLEFTEIYTGGYLPKVVRLTAVGWPGVTSSSVDVVVRG